MEEFSFADLIKEMKANGAWAQEFEEEYQAIEEFSREPAIAQEPAPAPGPYVGEGRVDRRKAAGTSTFHTGVPRREKPVTRTPWNMYRTPEGQALDAEGAEAYNRDQAREAQHRYRADSGFREDVDSKLASGYPGFSILRDEDGNPILDSKGMPQPDMGALAPTASPPPSMQRSYTDRGNELGLPANYTQKPWAHGSGEGGGGGLGMGPRKGMGARHGQGTSWGGRPGNVRGGTTTRASTPAGQAKQDARRKQLDSAHDAGGTILEPLVFESQQAAEYDAAKAKELHDRVDAAFGSVKKTTSDFKKSFSKLFGG